MGFKITSIGKDKFELEVFDESANVHPLNMAPVSREPELDSGTWLILAFAVWGIPDLDAINVALKVAKRLEQHIKLGIRPFDFPQEIRTWCPEVDMPSASELILTCEDQAAKRRIDISSDTSNHPIWLVFRDGRMINAETGPRHEDDLIELLHSIIQ